MDPNANITRQRVLANEIISNLSDLDSEQWRDEQERSDFFEERARDGEALAELVLALDEWRRKGGFDPYKEG